MADPAPPTLARLSFRVPPAQMSAFADAYTTRLLPILLDHGLLPSSRSSRPTPANVFSRLFAVNAPDQVARVRRSLEADSAWSNALKALGTAFSPSGQEGFLSFDFRSYEVPADPGRRLPGKTRQGHWRSYTSRDGLAKGMVWSMMQDREGYIWFSTIGGGVSRFDGQLFTTFTAEDGLAGNDVGAVLQDRDGRIWAISVEGVSRLDKEGRWSDPTPANGRIDNNLRAATIDREGRLWIGISNLGTSCYDGREWKHFTAEDGLADNNVWSILQDRDGNLWFGTLTAGVSRFDGKNWKHFTAEDGLADNNVRAIFQDRDGNLWFGTFGGGISRFDGRSFISLTEEDGLANNKVWSILQDRDGFLWFATSGGASRYDGKTFANFTTQEGLGDIIAASILQDRDGNLWFGTGSGASRYDGKTFATFAAEDRREDLWIKSMVQDRKGSLWLATGGGGARMFDGKSWSIFTVEDGLLHNEVQRVLEDREGALWFATHNGVSRYDGRTWTSFTIQDGLVDDKVRDIVQDREGALWFATHNGVSRYDGRRFTNLTAADGLMHNHVWSILEDRDGNLWFGSEGGASRYDGRAFTHFGTREGLLYNEVFSILQDREGDLWFSTIAGMSRYRPADRSFSQFTARDGLATNHVWYSLQDRGGHLWFTTFGGEGASRYDGRTFQTLTAEDGLADNNPYSILEDREGNLWFGHANGHLTRFRKPEPDPPPVSIHTVVANHRYTGASALSLPSTVGLLSFEFSARSFRTRPGAVVYRYRLAGYDDSWQNTTSRRVEYQDLPVGRYTFEVVAADRDLVYSHAPATVALNIHPPYERLGWITALSLSLLLAAWQTARVVRRDRRLRKEAEKELQTAHDMQMGLMPAAHPQLEGYEIAGRCLPSNHVGGDFFQYFILAPDRFAVALADVTGHAMEAAIPAVMFSGILESEIRHAPGIEALFGRLNQALHKLFSRGTHICFALGEFNPSCRTLRLCNCGCPYPYHYRAETGDLVELKTTAFPLGARPDTLYQVLQTQLHPGDRIVFCSDGLMEARDREGRFLSFERTADIIRSTCRDGLSARAALDRIFKDVETFRGTASQSDDMTCVVLRVH
jgi:ligand-binding sensor domain-containing protein/serine phosphatase RsbU (regulator of sigma subunit)